MLVLVVAVTFVELGRWQLRRHDERAALNAGVAASLAHPVAPVEEILSVGDPPSADLEWRQVEVVGTYDVEHELLLRNQSYDGNPGFEVITPLVTAAGPALLVDRGWAPVGETATDSPAVPGPPLGEVAVRARVRLGTTEDAESAGLPEGQIRQIAVHDIAGDLPYPVYGAYAALLPGEPGAGTGAEPPRVSASPEPSSGPHLAYAVQWFLFTLIALGGWVVLLRGEARPGPAGTRQKPDAPALRPRVHT